MARVSHTLQKKRPSLHSAEAFLAFTVDEGAHFVREGFESGMSELRWFRSTKLCKEKEQIRSSGGSSQTTTWSNHVVI